MIRVLLQTAIIHPHDDSEEILPQLSMNHGETGTGRLRPPRCLIQRRKPVFHPVKKAGPVVRNVQALCRNWKDRALSTALSSQFVLPEAKFIRKLATKKRSGAGFFRFCHSVPWFFDTGEMKNQ
jgi:hypothetical protein